MTLCVFRCGASAYIKIAMNFAALGAVVRSRIRGRISRPLAFVV